MATELRHTGRGVSRRAELRATVESPLPARLGVGGGTALFVCGWCFLSEQRVRALHVRVGAYSSPAIAHGMPRPDVRAATGVARAYRSGFWAIVPIPGPVEDPEQAEVAVHATLADGTDAEAPVATTLLAPDGGVSSAGLDLADGATRTPEVAICMATFEPPPDLLRQQIDSIRAQTHAGWTCVISDDASSPQSREGIRALIEGDERFTLVENDTRVGFFHNFERALMLAPARAPFVALADQDDRWHPDKLAVLLDAIGDANLAYGDARIVERDGMVRSPTYWSVRPNNWTDLASLSLANTVSGGAALYRRSVIERALPFPPAFGRFFQDHWLAIVALATGEIAYLDRPVYDYVQHPQTALGHEAANAWALAGRPRREKLALARRDPQFFYEHWRQTYFSEYCRVALLGRVVLLRCVDTLEPGKRRALERLGEPGPSPRLTAWLAARRLRRMVGADETLGAEGRLLRAFAWRWLLATLSARLADPPKALPRDSRFAARRR